MRLEDFVEASWRTVPEHPSRVGVRRRHGRAHRLKRVLLELLERPPFAAALTHSAPSVPGERVGSAEVVYVAAALALPLLVVPNNCGCGAAHIKRGGVLVIACMDTSV